MAEENETRWVGIRNAKSDAGIEVVQDTAADLNVTAALSAVDNAVLDAIAADTAALNDDSAKGLLRSFGDAGTTPTNVEGNTLLSLLDIIKGYLRSKDGDTGTHIAKSLVGQGGTTVVIHTVTTAKTLYLTSAHCNALARNADEREGRLYVANASDAEQYTLLQAMVSQKNNGETANTYPHPIPIAAGFKIVLTVSTSAFCTAGFTGWEE